MSRQVITLLLAFFSLTATFSLHAEKGEIPQLFDVENPESLQDYSRRAEIPADAILDMLRATAEIGIDRIAGSDRVAGWAQGVFLRPGILLTNDHVLRGGFAMPPTDAEGDLYLRQFDAEAFFSSPEDGVFLHEVKARYRLLFTDPLLDLAIVQVQAEGANPLLETPVIESDFTPPARGNRTFVPYLKELSRSGDDLSDERAFISSGEIESRSNGSFHFRTVITKGFSGSPIFAERHGQLLLVGIATGIELAKSGSGVFLRSFLGRALSERDVRAIQSGRASTAIARLSFSALADVRSIVAWNYSDGGVTPLGPTSDFPNSYAANLTKLAQTATATPTSLLEMLEARLFFSELSKAPLETPYLELSSRAQVLASLLRLADRRVTESVFETIRTHPTTHEALVKLVDSELQLNGKLFRMIAPLSPARGYKLSDVVSRMFRDIWNSMGSRSPTLTLEEHPGGLLIKSNRGEQIFFQRSDAQAFAHAAGQDTRAAQAAARFGEVRAKRDLSKEKMEDLGGFARLRELVRSGIARVRK